MEETTYKDSANPVTAERLEETEVAPDSGAALIDLHQYAASIGVEIQPFRQGHHFFKTDTQLTAGQARKLRQLYGAAYPDAEG